MISDDPTLEEAAALYRSVLVLTPEQRLERVKHLLAYFHCEIRGVTTETKNGGHKVKFETYVYGHFDPAAFEHALEDLTLKGVCCLDRRWEMNTDGYASMDITFFVNDPTAYDPQQRMVDLSRYGRFIRY